MDLNDYSEQEIKAAIALKGTTITELAKDIPTSPQYLSRVFKGKANIASQTVNEAVIKLIGPELKRVSG